METVLEVWLLLKLIIRFCCSVELLRRSAEQTLMDMVQLLFSRYISLAMKINYVFY